MSSNQDSTFQPWNTIHHDLSFSETDFDPDLNRLQDADGLMFLPDSHQESALENVFEYPDPNLNDVGILVKKGYLDPSPDASNSDISSGKKEPPRRSRGRPRLEDKRTSTTTIEVI
jgi:hypothetical protein